MPLVCSLGVFLLTIGLARPAKATPSEVDLSKLPPAAAREVDFVKDVQPIFAGHCYDCHGPAKQEAQFRLDLKEVALQGGELGPAIVPGKGAESLLVQAVGGVKADLIMPKKGQRLTAEQIGFDFRFVGGTLSIVAGERLGC